MAACTNNGGSRARRAVTAALVGVLSVGAVPMAAVAEGVADGIAPLFAEGTEFSEGTLNNLRANGYLINDNDGDGVLDITIDNASKLSMRIDADSFTPAGWSGTPFTFNQADSDFSMRLYHADEDGNPVGAAVSNFTITSAGNYAVVVEALAGSEYAGQIYVTRIEVKGMELPAVEAFEGDNTGDTQFIYTGSALDVNFKVDGRGNFLDAAGDELVEGVDYTVSYTLGGKAVDAVEGVGTYTATLTGLGAYAGSTAQTSVKVTAFDLSNADVTVQVDPFSGEAPTSPSRVYYHNSGNDTLTYLDPSLVGIAVQGTVSANSTYTFDVTANTEAVNAGNVMISTPVTATGVKVANSVSFRYAGADLQDSYQLVAADGDAFNVAAITATNGSSVVPCAVDHIVMNGTYYYATDADFNEAVNALATGQAGTYEIVVGSCDNAPFNYGGAKAFTVTIYEDAVDADTQLYVYHGSASAITSYSKLYDGTPVTASEFSVGGNGIDSSKLNVVLTDSKGRVIDQAVDAGEYYLEVTSDDYLLSGTTRLPITIGRVDLTALEATELELWNNVAGEEYLPYMPNAGEPNRVNTAWSIVRNLGLEVDGEALPENLDIRVQYDDEGEWVTVGSLDDFGAGSYRVVVAVAESAASNYVLPEGETSVTLSFTVAHRGTFSDVQPSYWGFEAVELANWLGYMTGYGNTGVFGPDDLLTRGQAVSVLYKMSGFNADAISDTNDMYIEGIGWVTGYDDVNPEMYYAEAIAWAKATGVVNGYDEDTFGPDDEITREQFAGMLSNYAKVVNRDETVGTADVEAVLAEFPDGAQVSDWAAEAVAWAASATDDRGAVMGNNGTLMPGNTISRAEVAAMVTNYQPVRNGHTGA